MNKATAIGLTIALPCLFSLYTLLSLSRNGLEIKKTVSGTIRAKGNKTVYDQHSALMSSMMDSYETYVPAYIEQHIYNHSVDLGYASLRNPKGCKIWKDESSPIQKDLLMFNEELKNYTQALNSHPPIPDLRKQFALDHSNQIEICKKTALDPENGLLQGFFRGGQLSLTRAGYVEPLLPPMRHPDFCLARGVSALMDLNYLVHDFETMCRRLTRTSRTVLIDMGASLDFHTSGAHIVSPALYISEVYHKFGFPFDHIYAYEMTQVNASRVQTQLPDGLRAAWHWINAPVNPDPDSIFNPFKTLLENYGEEDLVVVKIDIDGGPEMPFLTQILNDARLSNMIDHLYFENHVHLGELAGNWGSGMKGTIKDTLDLFRSMRDKGVAAHYWV
jgi:hypothetical protein